MGSGPCNPRLGAGVSTFAWEGLRERPEHPLAGGRTKVRGGTQKFGPRLGEPETHGDNFWSSCRGCEPYLGWNFPRPANEAQSLGAFLGSFEPRLTRFRLVCEGCQK